MKHFASPQFWKRYYNLPLKIRKLADKSFELLKSNSTHPSLHLKKVDRFWSVRIGISYRALSVETSEGFLWFWIGTHGEYDKLINS